MKHAVIMAGGKDEICAGRTLKDLYIEVYGHASADPEQTGEGANRNA